MEVLQVRDQDCRKGLQATIAQRREKMYKCIECGREAQVSGVIHVILSYGLGLPALEICLDQRLEILNFLGKGLPQLLPRLFVHGWE